MKRVLVPILSLVMISCNAVQEPANKTEAFDIVVVKNYIEEMNKTYGDRFLHNDTGFYYTRYCKDAVAMPDQQPAVIGRDSIISFNYNNGANKEFKVIITAENIYGNSELVVEEGIYSFPDEKGGSYDNGKFIALWKHEDGKWKLYREIWNSNNKPTAR